MEKEDATLPVDIGKLEIEPVKVNVAAIDENPFTTTQWRQSMFTKSIMHNTKCVCVRRKSDITIPIYKKRTNKLLKDPTLKVLQLRKDKAIFNTEARARSTVFTGRRLYPTLQNEHMSLCSLVDNCNQLRISSESDDLSTSSNTFINKTQWWSMPKLTENKEPSAERSRSGPSCSQQALNPPCDITIDELASYFETLVHIPKKMSSMAEMMYI